jgi:hypothetical protein
MDAPYPVSTVCDNAITIASMDIHPPEHPIHSLKDFAVHIGVVTCGIIIALSLELALEALHNRHLVRETRANIHIEMEENFHNTRDELARINLYKNQLQALQEDLPSLAKDHPEEISKRLSEIINPEYFFSATSWQSALTTGSLSHMSTEEVSAYAGAAESIRIYSNLQQQAEEQENNTTAFFTAHSHPSPEELQQGMEHLILFYRAERSLTYVGPQMKRQIEAAVRASAEY